MVLTGCVDDPAGPPADGGPPVTDDAGPGADPGSGADAGTDAGAPLCYGVAGGPSGMTIDPKGELAWQPTDADMAASPYAFDVTITTAAGGRVTVPVSLEVTRDGFVFVAPNGDDGAAGTLDAPFATIEHGLRALDPAGPRTLMIRGGTYAEAWNWETGGVISPFRGEDYTPEAPAEVLGYPAEAAILDAEWAGHGYYAFQTRYVLFRDLEVRRASADEGGGAIAQESDHIVFQRVTVRDSDWTASANCTGFLLSSPHTVCHRCAAFDNYDRGSGSGAEWNSSNYLVYTEDTAGPRSIVESVSGGSVVGFKIKHGGPGTLLLQGVRDDGSDYGFGGADDGLVIRASHFVDNRDGIILGLTDPSASVATGDMRVEGNVVRRSTGFAFGIQTGYPGEGVVVRRNVFQTDATLGGEDESPALFHLWPYEEPQDELLDSDENCFSAPNDDAGFRVGPRPVLGWDAWRARGHDAASTWGPACVPAE